MDEDPNEPYGVAPRLRRWTLIVLLIAVAIAVGTLLQFLPSPDGPLIGRIILGVVACLWVISRK
jgi:uncharacterized membrane protein AbrB (regulator of aidB expression)